MGARSFYPLILPKVIQKDRLGSLLKYACSGIIKFQFYNYRIYL